MTRPLPSSAFQKGKSGNPSGRPKGLERKIRELVAAQRENERDGWERLALIMFNLALGKPPPELKYCEVKPADCIRAIEWLHDRAFGKAKIVTDVVDVNVVTANVPLKLDGLSDGELHGILDGIRKARELAADPIDVEAAEYEEREGDGSAAQT